MKEEILSFTIKSIQPEVDRSTILDCHFTSPSYPKISIEVEQNVESARASIMQSLVWSQGHLVVPNKFVGQHISFLNEDIEEYFGKKRGELKKLSEVTSFIDTNRHGSIDENSHIREVRTAYQKGVDAALKVLEIDPLKTANVLSGTLLNGDELQKIDEQIKSFCGYYAAFEALSAKKTTAKDFVQNPFTVILALIKDGARNFDLSGFDSKGTIKAEIFVQKENKVMPLAWTSRNRKNIYYNK